MSEPPIVPGQPQIVTKPGGLSGAAHAVHILICFFTCGLWIPGYLLFMIFTPSTRREVIVPYGADPQAVAAAHAQAAETTPAERRTQNSTLLVMAITFVVVLGCIIISTVR